MHLKMKPLNETATAMYKEHGHFHAGDAGLDLYVLETINIAPGETLPIKLGVACEPVDGRAYFFDAAFKYFEDAFALSEFDWVD